MNKRPRNGALHWLMNQVEKTKKFVQQEFRKRPHHSFGDWTVMHNHSVMVCDVALDIADHVGGNKTIIGVAALLHDIGKTYQVDESTLHAHHHQFNLVVGGKFLETLELPSETLKKVQEILSYQSKDQEMDIVRDADIVSFYLDKRLHDLFYAWAKDRNLAGSIQKKLAKFEKLKFEYSRTLCQK